nr:MAG TPA: hypothetical protein [Caudoviricetes sp.]
MFVWLKPRRVESAGASCFGVVSKLQTLYA